MADFELLEEIDDIIYISDIENYELLYINKNGRKLIGNSNYLGKKCYEVLQGLDKPCSFCTNSKITKDEMLVWEHENTHLKRHYIVKDKLIQLDGKPARFELAVDITKKENISRAVLEKLEIEKKMIECIKIMTEGATFEDNIHNVLEIIREFHDADRAYIIETNNMDETGYTIYNRTSKSWQKEDIRDLIEWKFRYFKEHDALKATSVVDEHIPEKIQAMFLNNDVHSLISIPLKRNTEIYGFVGLDNPRKGLNENSLLDSMVFYFMAELETRKIESHLRFLVYHDERTGFLNRNSLIKTMIELNRDEIQQMGVICLKLDENPGFNLDKNELYVDENVRQMTSMLKECFHMNSIYTPADDYFVILFFNKTREEFDEDCLQLKKVMMMNKDLRLSSGVIWTDRNIPMRDLIISADELVELERAKLEKENSFENRNVNINNVRRLCNSIAEGDFRVYLQPKFDASSQKIIGAEALIRYFHPERGIVYPDQFIASLERGYSIKYIDFFVLEEVCKLIKQWSAWGYKIDPISVNISRITILEEDFLERVIEIVDRYQVNHKLIELEITETVDSMDRLLLINLTKKIKEAGLALSLDDFGSKYANLSLLASIELDIIKIDKSMVDDLVCSDRSRLVLKGIIEFAKKFGLKTIAEGVENAEQVAILKEMECDYIQGYYFSKPISIEEYMKHYIQGESQNENYTH